jgi:hypothetical protein
LIEADALGNQDGARTTLAAAKLLALLQLVSRWSGVSTAWHSATQHTQRSDASPSHTVHQQDWHMPA